MRTRRTKEQIRKDNYNKDVDAYNFYVVNLDTMRAETGFEFREDAVDLLNDYDDKKKYKVVSKRALKSMGIENPNESFKYEGGGDFQSGVYATGGEVRRFNRYEQMDSATREEIMDVIQDLEIRNPLTNYLYGLFDGYDYSKTKNFKIQMNKLRAKDFSLHKRIKEIYSKIDKYKFEKYDSFAKGGGLDSHGIKQGDTFLKTLSGGIQQVKDKNGNIFYINLATGERSATIPLPFDDGGEVKYFINKDGIRVRSVAKPEKKLSEREWMAKHNESKEARSYAFGGFFGKSDMMSRPKHVDLDDKQVRLKSGEYVQVLDQDGSSLMVMEVSKLGTGASPKMVKIDDVDMTSFAGGGGVEDKLAKLNLEKSKRKVDRKLLEKVYEYYLIYKDGTNREHYNDFNNIEKVKEHIEKRTGMKVLNIKELEKGKTYPYNPSDPYYHDIYEFELVKGQPLIIERIYGRPNWIGNVSYENFIEVKNLPKMANGGGVDNYFNKMQRGEGYRYDTIHLPKDLKEEVENFIKKGYNELVDDGKGKLYLLNKDSEIGKSFEVSQKEEIQAIIENFSKQYAKGGGVGLIGNQKRIDMNHNGRIDAEDFKLLRSSMNGAWRKEHKYVNSTSRKDGKVIDYEVRYARKNNPSKKGYKGKTFATGGSIERKYNSMPKEEKEELMEWQIGVGRMPFNQYEKFSQLTEHHKKLVERHFRNEAKKMTTGGEVGKIEVGDKIKVKAKGVGEDFVIVEGFDSANQVLTKSDDPNTYLAVRDSKGYAWEIYLKEVVEFPLKHKMAKGGAFEKLSNKVARNYEGKRVKPQYQKEYGKVYSKEEAKEVGDKVAGKVKAMQKAESGASVKKGGQGGIMILAKKIRKEGESWKDALKRAGQQLK